jgi:hypothetical protein
MVDVSTIEVVAGIVLSVAGVYLGYRAYQLKLGVRFRGEFIPTSSIYCDEMYVSRVTIENVKDRAATIYAVYLRIGPSVYLELEDFEDSPLVLGAFETYQKDFDPVDFHTEGTRRIPLTSLLQNRRVSKRLILSTSDGRYAVRRPIKRWNPIVDFFKNYATAIVRPVRTIYKGKAYGSAAYLVEFKLADGAEQVMPVSTGDYQFKTFRHFDLTRESLETATTLENFLNSQVDQGNLSVDSVSVRDLREMREDWYPDHFTETVEAPDAGWFEYQVMGRILTWRDNRKVKKENLKRQRERANKRIERTP